MNILFFYFGSSLGWNVLISWVAFYYQIWFCKAFHRNATTWRVGLPADVQNIMEVTDLRAVMDIPGAQMGVISRLIEVGISSVSRPLPWLPLSPRRGGSVMNSVSPNTIAVIQGGTTVDFGRDVNLSCIVVRVRLKQTNSIRKRRIMWWASIILHRFGFLQQHWWLNHQYF